MELYQKVENLIGVKLEKYPMNNEEVLLLVESVTNALRLASNVCFISLNEPFK